MRERRVILVTGSSRGIGSHLVHHFLERDWDVIGCSRGEADLGHDRYAHRAADVGSETDVTALFRFIRESYGRLDAAVNNAASNPTLSLVALTSGTAATQALASNVLGPFLVCREAVKLMMRRKFGRIVNIGSMATRHELPGEAIYTASKSALNAMTRVLAKEVAGHGITCNVVAPAAVEEGGLMNAVDPESLREVLSRNAIAGVGSAADVAAVVEWLVRGESGAVTGQVVYLGGA